MAEWNLTPKQWLAWLGSTFVAGIMLVSYAYANFTTVREFRSHKEDIQRSLDRIEQRQDMMLKRYGLKYIEGDDYE